ncbi:hypothetical protein SAMN04488074_104331 [Lentzea albidocapillata subsp. violacea]|uniref:DUF2690 domain-containing protein n=1 Tax=Lentzea albidocapillata subsp. violacea TaxID=128104 RepID=A0A1G8ZFN0_9PSEU|nr:hypothetical protein [Lentzea albidocapillata]SDK13225.1 hypothetical protein SAMN04488074_104331 [Lentzea albidocapillata subsp. violacea]
MLKRIGAAVLAAAAVAVMFTGTAQAEYNPKCTSGVTQIGSTSYIKLGSATIASVKQFKGCNKNWAYTYVWDSWLSSHKRDFYVYTGVWTKDGQAARDQVSGSKGQREVWSSGANTLSVCTAAKGSIQSVESGYWENAFTDLRC